MPKIIPEEERRERLLGQPLPTPSESDHTAQVVDPSIAAKFRDFDAEVEASEGYTSTATSKQKGLIDMQIKYTDIFYPIYLAQHPEEQHVDPLALDNVPALVKRLKTFLSYLRSETKGFLGKGRPSVNTMASFVNTILLMVQERIEKSCDASTVEAEERRVMIYSGDGEQGLQRSLYRHAEYLCKQYSLPAKVFDRPPYGWNEAVLLLGAMRQHILEGRCDGITPVASVLETMLLVQLAFLTGLRAGSLCDSDQGNCKGVRLGSIRIEQAARHEYTVHFVVTSLKGHHGSALAPVHRPVVIPPIQMVENIFFDPVVPLVACLIIRGALVEKGGAIITSIASFQQSSAAEFIAKEAFADAPLFQTHKTGHTRSLDGGVPSVGAGQPLDVYGVAARLQPWITQVGLPHASLHLFRHDFAQEVQSMMGSDFARLALDHTVDPLNQHYTGGISLYNVSSLRLGEASSSIQTSHLSRYGKSPSVGVKASALKALAPSAASPNPPSHSWPRRRVESAAEDSTLKQLWSTFEGLSGAVERELGIKLERQHRATGIKAAQQALDQRRLGVNQQSHLSTTLQELQDISKQISGRYSQLSQERKTAGREQLREQTRQLPSTIRNPEAGPSSQPMQQAAPQPVSVFDLQEAQAGIQASHAAQVAELEARSASCELSGVQAAQITLANLYLEAYSGRSRLDELQDWMQKYRICPLCSVGRSHMKLAWSSAESVQGFIPEGLKHERLGTWEHLTHEHPEVVDTLRLGAHLHPGVFMQPNLGATYAIHPLVDQGESLTKLLGPPALEDKESLSLWLGAPSLVHDPSRSYLDGHRAGKRVFQKLSLSEPVTSTDDVGYLLDDFFIDRNQKSKRRNIDGIMKDDGVLRLEMAPRRAKTARPAELTAELASKPMFAPRPSPHTSP